MTLIVSFAGNRDPACTACPLHGSALVHRCIPARPADFTAPQVSNRQALLVVGQGPGYEEDLGGKCFAGPTGRLTHDLLGPPHGPPSFDVGRYADVYLTNISRCQPPRGGEPTIGQCKKCARLYLFEDLRRLQAVYPDVTVLLLGAKAVGGFLDCSFKQAVAHQGKRLRPMLPGGETIAPVTVFSTYHFAYLLSGRNPTAARAVNDHLTLLRDHLAGTLTYPAEAPQVELGTDPRELAGVDLLCLDIETYGAIAGRTQTVFDPHRSVYVDGCPPSELIQTVALTWPGPAGLRSAGYVWADLAHRQAVETILAGHARAGGTLLLMNALFDLSYLRFCSLYLARWLHPEHGLLLRDLAITNYLHNEQRPERSLKAIAPLLRVGNYDADHPLPAFDATDARDPRLLAYNALDAYRTYESDRLLRLAIARDFGPATAKLTPTADRFYSDLLWSLLHMAEAGMPFDLRTLRRLHARMHRRMKRANAVATGRHGFACFGPGSRKPLEALFTAAAQEALDACASPREAAEFRRHLAITAKTRKVSTGKENMALLRQTLRPGPTRRAVRTLGRFRDAEKLVSSYTKPLLHSRTKGLTRGWAWPTWYPCPSRSEDADEREGGTKQGRVACQRPALQTAPPPVKAAFTTRFRGGELWSYDESQLELRVAALCSGDPVMLADYNLGGTGTHDAHRRTGLLVQDILYTHNQVSEILDPDTRAFKDTFRQLGKRINFLTLYRGGAFRLAWSVRSDMGLELPEPVAADLITQYYQVHGQLWAWQEELIETAIRRGFLELLTGRSRHFVGSRQVILDTYVNEICNFPVQSYAADVLLDAQRLIREGLRAAGLRSVMPAQTYDQVFIDIAPGERPAVEALVGPALTTPPLWLTLQTHFGRACPLAYEAKRYYPKEPPK